MKLDLTERYLIFQRRAWLIDKTISFHADMYKLKNHVFPVPDSYKAIDLGRLSLGEVAFVLRWRAKLSTRAVGKALKVSHQTVTNWEYDRKGEVIRQIKHLKDHLKPSEVKLLKHNNGIEL